MLWLPIEGGIPATICTQTTAPSAPRQITYRRRYRGRSGYREGRPWGTTLDTPKTRWYQGQDVRCLIFHERVHVASSCDLVLQLIFGISDGVYPPSC
jgi:hypothetical protein